MEGIEKLNKAIEEGLELNNLDYDGTTNLLAEAKKQADYLLENDETLALKSNYSSEVDRLTKNLKLLNVYIATLEKPKKLRPYDRSAERGKALTESLSSGHKEFIAGLENDRRKRYDEIVDEQDNNIESPMDRLK